MLFSIIIPVYNSESYLYDSINSAVCQNTKNKFSYEVIVVDDCSTDDSINIAKTFSSRKNYYILSTGKNSGPGIARNVGFDRSSGKYILFLDSDDYLDVNALSKLYNTLVLDGFNSDLIAYNWKYLTNKKLKDNDSDGGRRDIDSLLSKEGDLVNNYLSMKMDGSVIYTLIKRSVITENNIRFCCGYHEDIDYIFKLYYFSNGIIYMSDRIYYKRRLNSSITGHITKKHIVGYIRAWKEIFDFICIEASHKKLINEYIVNFRSGLTGAIAILVIAISKLNCKNPVYLFHLLYKQYINNFVNNETYVKYIQPLPNITYYDKVSVCFIKIMESSDKDLVETKVLKCIEQHNRR